MLASKQAKSVFLLAAVAAASSAAEDIVWSTSGGGWRSMVAQSAYAQVFGGMHSPTYLHMTYDYFKATEYSLRQEFILR
jgi:hypothetical protein